MSCTHHELIRKFPAVNYSFNRERVHVRLTPLKWWIVRLCYYLFTVGEMESDNIGRGGGEGGQTRSENLALFETCDVGISNHISTRGGFARRVTFWIFRSIGYKQQCADNIDRMSIALEYIWWMPFRGIRSKQIVVC